MKIPDIGTARMQEREEAPAVKGARHRDAFILQQRFHFRVAGLDNSRCAEYGNLDSTLADMQRSHDTNAETLNANASRGLRDAYVNMMLAKRDLPQQLAAQGISGGLTESTLAGLNNQYGSARGEINTGLNDSMTQLLNALMDNQGQANRAYTEQLAADEANRVNYEMQLRSNLENRIADIMSSQYDNISQLDSTYYQNMMNLAKQQAAASAAATNNANLQAGNGYEPLSYSQAIAAANAGMVNPNVLSVLRSYGYTDQNIYGALLQSGLYSSAEQIWAAMNQ